jgi:uracil-DNA glycosylase family 4
MCKESYKLFNKILFCPINKLKLNDLGACQRIIEVQKENKHKFQFAEPWNGDIENAKILFVSSNPAIDFDEYFPTYDIENETFVGNWNEEEIKNFFYKRFTYFSNKRNNAKLTFKKVVKNESGTPKTVKYWTNLNARAKELIGRKAKLNNDFAITEIVHCKSKSEVDIDDKCLESCSNNYLKEIISLSNAKLIVAVGKKAKEVIYNLYLKNQNITDFEKNKLYGPFEINNKHRYFLYICHPNTRKEIKKLDKVMNIDELKTISNLLNDNE